MVAMVTDALAISSYRGNACLEATGDDDGGQTKT